MAFVIYVPKNVTLEKPLQLINILRGGVDLNVNRRLLIIAEENARVKLLVCDHTVDDVHFVVTQVTEVFAADSAQVDVYELEENSEKVTRLSNLFSEQKEHSTLQTSSITLHNGYTRNNYCFRLLGEYAETHVGGWPSAIRNSISTTLPSSITLSLTVQATNCLKQC